MQKVIIICSLFLLFCVNSYSQEGKSKIKMLPVSENFDFEKKGCSILSNRYSSYIFYSCSQEKIIYTSFLEDTLIVIFELKIRFHFTDTSAYFIIEEINKLTPKVLLYEKEKERAYIAELIFQKMQNSEFYYKGREYELEENSLYINMPLKFIPQKK